MELDNMSSDQVTIPPDWPMYAQVLTIQPVNHPHNLSHCTTNPMHHSRQLLPYCPFPQTGLHIGSLTTPWNDQPSTATDKRIKHNAMPASKTQHLGRPPLAPSYQTWTPIHAKHCNYNRKNHNHHQQCISYPNWTGSLHVGTVVNQHPMAWWRICPRTTWQIIFRISQSLWSIYGHPIFSKLPEPFPQHTTTWPS